MASLVFIALFALFTPSFALNYFLDASCAPFPAVSRALPEALLMAGRSDTRLGANDADIQTAFQRIYNTNTGDAGSVSEVRRIMSGISQMASTAVLRSADLRIYCDEDARWVLQPDRVINKKNIVVNSKRKAKNQVWIDRTNGIFYKGPPGCKDGGTIAEVFDKAWPGSTTQNPTRAAMTICKPYVTGPIASVGEQGNKDFSKVKLTDDALGELLSVTLMHELTHIPAFDTVDKDPAYGWEDIIAKSTADALKNAENYAFFGLLSLLGDKSFKLSTVDQDAKAGKLVRTTATYPKRMVAAVRSLTRCKDRSVRARDPKCKGLAALAGVVDFLGKV